LRLRFRIALSGSLPQPQAFQYKAEVNVNVGEFRVSLIQIPPSIKPMAKSVLYFAVLVLIILGLIGIFSEIGAVAYSGSKNYIM
jgi:hypothetical protein